MYFTAIITIRAIIVTNLNQAPIRPMSKVNDHFKIIKHFSVQKFRSQSDPQPETEIAVSFFLAKT